MFLSCVFPHRMMSALCSRLFTVGSKQDEIFHPSFFTTKNGIEQKKATIRTRNVRTFLRNASTSTLKTYGRVARSRTARKRRRLRDVLSFFFLFLSNLLCCARSRFYATTASRALRSTSITTEFVLSRCPWGRRNESEKKLPWRQRVLWIQSNRHHGVGE